MRLTKYCKLVSAFLILLFVISQNAYADSPHATCSKQFPCLVLHYHLYDIGETDLEPGDLTKLKNKQSLGPSINNAGTIVSNRSSGGFVYKLGHGEYTPFVKGAKINFYGINNQNDIIVGLTRAPKSVEWFLWPTCNGWCNPRITINTVELEGYKVTLNAINDQRMIIGEAHPDERSMPIAWNGSQGLHRLGRRHDIDLHGTVKGINNFGWIVGHTNCYHENFPFVWNGCEVADLSKLRARFHPPTDGKIHFEDLSITNDGLIYGTYWIDTEFLEDTSKKPIKYQGFAWNPTAKILSFVALDGMRIAKVNSTHRKVGSLNGKAAFADDKLKPTELSSAIDNNELKGWELLEATDINDYGQIVGYGLLNGKMHIFFADPL